MKCGPGSRAIRWIAASVRRSQSGHCFQSGVSLAVSSRTSSKPGLAEILVHAFPGLALATAHVGGAIAEIAEEPRRGRRGVGVEHGVVEERQAAEEQREESEVRRVAAGVVTLRAQTAGAPGVESREQIGSDRIGAKAFDHQQDDVRCVAAGASGGRNQRRVARCAQSRKRRCVGALGRNTDLRQRGVRVARRRRVPHHGAAFHVFAAIRQPASGLARRLDQPHGIRVARDAEATALDFHVQCRAGRDVAVQRDALSRRVFEPPTVGRTGFAARVVDHDFAHVR